MTRIAVLDGDQEAVQALTRRLSVAFPVTGTTEPAAALDLIENGETDVLVTDILAGGIDGLDLIVEARRRRPSLPIVVVSASTEPGEHALRVVYRYTVPGSRWNGSEPDRERLIGLLGEGE